MEPWQPANTFERELREALSAGETDRLVYQLRESEFALPISAAAFAGREAPRWPTLTAEGRMWLTAYTSMESMKFGTDNAFENARVVTLAELAAGWPDPGWGLAINPGLPVQVLLDPAMLARVAAPSLLDDRAAEPAARTPVVQKLLRPVDIEALLSGVTRVSGYCHQLADVAHIATPQVLVEAVIAPQERAYYVTADGAVNMLRWPAVGLELYRSPYGGIDEAGRAAVDGWLIEEPPFTGLGFAPNRDQLIREYKIDGVGLPYGAEIWELTDDGVERRRAALDADVDQWLLVPPGTDTAASSEES